MSAKVQKWLFRSGQIALASCSLQILKRQQRDQLEHQKLHQKLRQMSVGQLLNKTMNGPTCQDRINAGRLCEDRRFCGEFKRWFDLYRRKPKRSDKWETPDTRKEYSAIPRFVFRGEGGEGSDKDILPKFSDGHVMTSAAAHVAGWPKNSMFTSTTSRLSVALCYAIHHRDVGEIAHVDVFQTTHQQIWTTISDWDLFCDPLHESSQWCGIRWGRWSYEIFGVGRIPAQSRVGRHSFRVSDEIKLWSESYQKEHPCCSFNTLPEGLEGAQNKV